MSSLLHPRQLISSLISSIPSSDPPQPSNPLQDAPPATQKALLTLHVLFPNELLPALDLLDRNLITRLTVTNHGQDQTQQRPPPNLRPVPHLQQGPPQERQGHGPRSPLGPRHDARSDGTMVLSGLGVRPDQLPRLQQGLPPHSPGEPHRERHPLLGEDAHHSDLPTPENRDLRPQSPHPQSHDHKYPRDQIRPPNSHHHNAPEARSPPHPQDSSGEEEDPTRAAPARHDFPRGQNAHHAASHALAAAHAVHAVFRCRSARAGEASQVPALRQGDIRVGGDAVRVVSGSGYEVRLDAWSCSCPAFAFKVLNLTDGIGGDVGSIPGESSGWSFGGLGVGSDVPVCKHLLACALVEHCAVFRELVETHEISIEELAGLAAGWAD